MSSPRSSSPPILLAPGSSSHALSAPPREPSRPRLDDHLVEPEGREEIVRGRRLVVSPSLPEHGDPHFRLDVLIGTHLSPGYTGSTDMLTRTDDDSDFASDTSVRREGIDPATGERYLEELAFEVVNTESNTHATEKAEDMTARGVRRVFALFVRRKAVSEWRQGRWVAMPLDAVIQDPCLVAPLPVRALVDAAAIGAAAVRGLLARKEPEMMRMIQQSELQGRRKALRTLVNVAGITLAADDEARIDACDDAAVLDRWVANGRTATTAGELFPGGAVSIAGDVTRASRRIQESTPTA